MLSSLYTHIAISDELFPYILVCYKAIKNRQAIVTIVKVFCSLLSAKALKSPSKLQPDRRLRVLEYFFFGHVDENYKHFIRFTS